MREELELSSDDAQGHILLHEFMGRQGHAGGPRGRRRGRGTRIGGGILRGNAANVNHSSRRLLH